MAVYQVLYWKDIPAQIRVYDGKRPKGYEMPEWFQKEIDRVAMAEGLTGTDDYLDAWQWSDKIERDGDVDEVASAVLGGLEQDYRARDK
ncbi:MAG: hypothetical protein HOE48_16955 [Candidatus Latescibacteria bacterium]|jgi:hypothetical protein|nr:hypothetical protein [Candidatus Latescibacterota bacterium]MBT4139614.1 hypothetical protein [Candidatus Latescibacterota bacterium]MBT5829247.1 hypothetical protein [Candidatus Latescibacterota bacterium]